MNRIFNFFGIAFVSLSFIINPMVVLADSDIKPAIIYATGKSQEISIPKDIEKEENTEEVSKLTQYQSLIINMTNEEATALRQILAVECHNQVFEGRVACCQVILNRVLSPKWPNTILGVIYQKNPRQFATTRMGKVTPNELEDDAISYIADGGELPLPNDYVYFATRKVNGRDFIKIDDHYFSR